MLIIRLQRTGRTNDPSFRIVVSDSRRSAKSSGYVERVGFYRPREHKVEVDAESVKHWLSKGAQMSSTVRNILINQKIIEGKKMPKGKAKKKNNGKNG